jgi:ectoine hydroxylase-related dioxygenase (phytanoyl-CoA dioxygenase family)
LNLAVALDEADESNGSLVVIPGSHLLGDLPCEPKPNFSKDESGRLYCSAPIGNSCKVPENLPQIQLKYKAGDVLVLHAHTVHKAEANPSPERWRRTMYFVYIKENEPFWPGWTARRSLLERYDSLALINN